MTDSERARDLQVPETHFFLLLRVIPGSIDGSSILDDGATRNWRSGMCSLTRMMRRSRPRDHLGSWRSWWVICGLFFSPARVVCYGVRLSQWMFPSGSRELPTVAMACVVPMCHVCVICVSVSK